MAKRTEIALRFVVVVTGSLRRDGSVDEYGYVTYVAGPHQFDGAWYTRDIGEAKRFVKRHNAEKWLAERRGTLVGNVETAETIVDVKAAS